MNAHAAAGGQGLASEIRNGAGMGDGGAVFADSQQFDSCPSSIFYHIRGGVTGIMAAGDSMGMYI